MRHIAFPGRARRALREAHRWLTAVALAAPLAACNDVLSVDVPSKVPTSALYIPDNAPVIVNGAVGDFECAYGAYVVASGMMAGELMDATSTAARWDYDRRTIDPNQTLYSQSSCEGLGTYTPISTARWSADEAVKHLEGWTDAQVPDRAALIAKAADYAGYSLILLGEGFCSAAVDGGGELSSDSVFALAIQRFDTALAAAGRVSDANTAKALRNLAHVGRARALRDRGNLAAARLDAQQVDSGFVAYVSADAAFARRENRVFAQNNDGHVVSIGPAYRNMKVDGTAEADPRVAVIDSGKTGSDRKTPLFYQTKYRDLSASIPFASWKEAQLIIAEAEGGVSAVAIINKLRALDGITTMYASTDNAAIQQQVIEERNRELFLQGERLFDLRRNPSIALVPAPGTPYSVATSKGGSYADQRCMPLPMVERLNNPNVPDTPAP